MAKHTLTWLAGRSTPVVTAVGAKRRKTAGGKVVASRRATAEEERQIAAGQWVRSRPPGQPGKKSSIRPHLGDGNLVENIRAKRKRIKAGASERKARPGEADYPEESAIKGLSK
ncbi:MAG: hypothetical protein AAFM92_03160 [Pseudomonadota bacterium]